VVVKKKKRREQPLVELEGVSFDDEGQVIINNDDKQGGDKAIEWEKDLLSVDEIIMLCKKVEVRIVHIYNFLLRKSKYSHHLGSRKG
jgi:hypothetical protein